MGYHADMTYQSDLPDPSIPRSVTETSEAVSKGTEVEIRHSYHHIVVS